MDGWVFVAAGAVVASAAAGLMVGKAGENAQAERLFSTLDANADKPDSARVDFQSFDTLPAPVARYFRRVLTDGQRAIRQLTMQQTGVLRTSTRSDSWSSFSAVQRVVPASTGFIWNARVRMPLGTHVRVLDSFANGVGRGRVSLLSAIPVAAKQGGAELNSGALHRYLAEAVWSPTALLPQFGVKWTAIDDYSALASLSTRGLYVALVFSFNDAGEVTGIFSPGRFGQFDDGYRQAPWEGHFRDYQQVAGMWVPQYGEVGWHVDGKLELVWKGRVIEAHYELFE